MSVLKTYGEDAGFKPSKTYRLKNGRIEGHIDGLEAVAQAIDFMLSTERFQHIIYSSDYGVELTELIGKPRSLVLGDIERRITEALEQDDRITGIEDFKIAFDREHAHVTFKAVTSFGDINMERNVDIG